VKAFATLYSELDATNSTLAKVAAVKRYLAQAPPADAAWAVHFLSGGRLKRLVGGAQLRQWLPDVAGYPSWLVEESYAAVGDLAETVSLLSAGNADDAPEASLADWVEERLLPLHEADPDTRRERITGWWRALPPAQVFLLTKLLTGALRVGVSQTLLARAVAELAGVPKAVIQHRLMGHWRPSAEAWDALLDPAGEDEDRSRPYPFFLASPLEREPAGLGDPSEWLAEWKWDGIRAQVVVRGDVFIWTRGEELVTGRYPEVAAAAAKLGERCALDGELLAWRDGVLPFGQLQRRIGRKRVGKKLLADVPVVFMAYDLLEAGGEDVRGKPLHERRAVLDALVADRDPSLRVSPLVPADSWPQLAARREESRARGVEGLMLKARGSVYGAGRERGAWWKWKVAPYTVDAVMIYAQAGHGRRASLFTDYTFAVWQGGELVPLAKAYSGLDDGEIRELDRWIRRNTLERFGPVRSVRAEQVFELAFEGINVSSRHKSGIAVRFPRIQRWRRDKEPAEADRLDALKALLRSAEP
jgi:DNA ligase-1